MHRIDLVVTEIFRIFNPPSRSHPIAASFYAIGLLLPAAGWLLMCLYASGGQRLVSRRLDPGFLHRLTIQYIGSVALYALAVLVSLLEFRLGLAICIGLTLL